MRTRAWIACMAVVAAAFGASAGPASAETITFSEPVAGEVPHGCTGEPVAVSGTAHFKFTGNSSLDTIKYQVELNTTGVSGIGLVTGARYVSNDQTSEMQHSDLDDTQSTIEQTWIFSRQGEQGTLLVGDDFRLRMIAHLTITNGVPRAEKFEFGSDCR